MCMDLRLGSYMDGLRDRVSQRVRGLRKNDSSAKRLPRFSLALHPRLKSVISAISFIVIAGVLAWSAQDLTYSQALRDWERGRLPSERVWAYALGNRGWNTPKPSPIVHQALKKLPASLDTAGSVWVSPHLEWIIVFTDPNQTVSHRLFCRECKAPPERWEPAGTGWSAFDQVLERLEREQAARPPAQKGRKTIKFVDSREIHY